MKRKSIFDYLFYLFIPFLCLAAWHLFYFLIQTIASDISAYPLRSIFGAVATGVVLYLGIKALR